MTTHEAAAELDVLPTQIARLCRAGKLPGSRIVVGRRSRRRVWKVSGASVRKRRAAQERRVM